ncbi:MAG: hypothetical protein JST61_06630 [Acidobacteria bacterium]|nr:hypothetical protein [Acidobacteriota bacterium]
METRATFFGAPIGELGWFASLLMGAAVGFAAFFLATFLGIVGIMFYNTAFHATVNYALSYLRGGLVAGFVTLIAAWGYLGRLWVKRVWGKR